MMSSVAPMWLPLGFNEWGPAAQALTLGLLTFVQEDVPTVSAALLAATGRIPWLAGFFGCFFGIWLGDALLYGIARGAGRPVLRHSWARRFLDPAAIARSEQWFAKKGTWLLLSSRFVPGTRLPTYAAAGFLRLPFSRFLFVTGIAVGIWTVAIFGLARTFGAELFQWVNRWKVGGWLIVPVILLLFIRLSGRIFGRNFPRRVRAAVGRWMRWEFWPPWLFYAPVVLNYLRLAVRYRGLALPTAANPGIFSGGFVGESKITTLRELSATSPQFTAEAHLLEGGTFAQRLAALEEIRDRHNVDYPFILKPDVGQRGVGVKLIRTREQATAYLQQTRAPLVVQRYARGPHEVGVFYYRFPHESRGHIFAITEKIFPTVVGDWQRTIEELIWNDRRARLVAAKYLERLGDRRCAVPAAGERVKLVEAGNHAQGCIFQDGARLWSAEFERCLDAISQKLEGFYIGRYDIRYSSKEELRPGGNFQIIELNGAASEATSIYDARNSLFSAYRTLFRQWELVFAIGAANRGRGRLPTRLNLLWSKWRECSALAGTYPLAD